MTNASDIKHILHLEIERLHAIESALLRAIEVLPTDAYLPLPLPSEIAAHRQRLLADLGSMVRTVGDATREATSFLTQGVTP